MATYQAMTKSEQKAVDRALGRKVRGWSNAQPTTFQGMKFASKLEARVYHRLCRYLASDERIFRQVRLPLLTIGSKPSGLPFYFTVDFAIVSGHNKIVRLADAKGRTSRDWARGKAACEAMYGIPVEEITE